MNLVEGETYFYCTCGLSKANPFCDGSHKDMPGYKPLKFVYDGPTRKKGLCGCKRNAVNYGPWCDNAHKDPKITDW